MFEPIVNFLIFPSSFYRKILFIVFFKKGGGNFRNFKQKGKFCLKFVLMKKKNINYSLLHKSIFFLCVCVSRKLFSKILLKIKIPEKDLFNLFCPSGFNWNL